LANSMRLSLLKGAHAASSSAAWQGTALDNPISHAKFKALPTLTGQLALCAE
jgi:hypothetical protein